MTYGNSSATLAFMSLIALGGTSGGGYLGSRPSKRRTTPQSPSNTTFTPKHERDTRSSTHEQDRAARFAAQAARRKSKRKTGKKGKAP